MSPSMLSTSAVLTALMFIGPVKERRFVDASEYSLYSDFEQATVLRS
jgi:hypothetical protein